MKRAGLTFGSRSRACTRKYVAFLEAYEMIPSLLLEFDVGLVEQSVSLSTDGRCCRRIPMLAPAARHVCQALVVITSSSAATPNKHFVEVVCSPKRASGSYTTNNTPRLSALAPTQSDIRRVRFLAPPYSVSMKLPLCTCRTRDGMEVRILNAQMSVAATRLCFEPL